MRMGLSWNIQYYGILCETVIRVRNRARKFAAISRARLQLDLEALDKFTGMAWVGGGGAIGDFGNNTRDWMLLEAFIKGGKPVAGICYGSIVFAQVKDSLTGTYLLQGHFATGHGDADNYTEYTATMNPDGTYYRPSAVLLRST